MVSQKDVLFTTCFWTAASIVEGCSLSFRGGTLGLSYQARISSLLPSEDEGKWTACQVTVVLWSLELGAEVGNAQKWQSKLPRENSRLAPFSLLPLSLSAADVAFNFTEKCNNQERISTTAITTTNSQPIYVCTHAVFLLAAPVHSYHTKSYPCSPPWGHLCSNCSHSLLHAVFTFW